MCARILSWARRMAARSTAIFLNARPLFSEEIAHRHPVGNRLEAPDKFAETLRKNGAAPAQVMIDAWRSDIVPKKFEPTLPELGVEQSIDIMIMDRLERFQELMGRMKKARLIFRRKRVEILQTDPPNPRELRIFH